MRYLGLQLALYSIFFSVLLNAQDSYHQSILDQLQSDHNITGGTWIVDPNESDLLNDAWFYGGDPYVIADATDQVFNQKVTLKVTIDYDNDWNAGWGVDNDSEMLENDVCLLVFWARTSNLSDGKLSAFVENNMTYEKEVFERFPVGSEWRQYFFPFQSNNSFNVGEFQLGFHVGAIQQEIEYAGINILNYKNAYDLEDLPRQINNDVYGGSHPDAPWRTEAQTRIENLRKAPIKITVKNSNGTPVENAGVEIKMLQHEYAFGAAVVSCAFADNDCQNDTYESKLLDLDGNGHGFNWVVFENGLKWDAWEDQWPTSQFEKADAIDWLRANDIQVRGHNLVWPSTWGMPNDIQLNIANIDYVKSRIDEHLEEILNYPSIKGNLVEWDVVNESTVETFLENSLAGSPGYETGREIYAEIYKKAKEEDPNAKLYVNDYVTISQQRSKGANYERYQSYIQELIDAGATVDGIGFQAHVGTYPTSINQVGTILDDFYAKFGLRHKITEFDMPDDTGDEVEAAYMKDFLTYVFSHPSTDGFLMWGFWDGAHWNNHAPMFNQDWSIKPSGQAFIDLVFKEWWTEQFEITPSNGVVELDGYKGKYVIQVNCDDIIRDTINLSEGGIVLEYDCQELLSVNGIDENETELFPNPSIDNARLKRSTSGPISIRIRNSQGQDVFSLASSEQVIQLPAELPKGSYFVEIIDGKKVERLTWIVQ